MLLGREAEQRVVDELLQSARTGRSAVLVLRGEPGIGKTALLGYAQSRADGMTVLRSVGIEAEHELPFAGLHQLLRPCLGLLDRLPPPQAKALRGAFGLSFDPVENPFLVSLGLLTLLAEGCEEAPLLCLIDDAHWLDRPSQVALAFAARRLNAEPIAMLAAARTQEPHSFEAGGLPELELSRLDDATAGALLQSRIERPARSSAPGYRHRRSTRRRTPGWCGSTATSSSATRSSARPSTARPRTASAGQRTRRWRPCSTIRSAAPGTEPW